MHEHYGASITIPPDSTATAIYIMHCMLCLYIYSQPHYTIHTSPAPHFASIVFFCLTHQNNRHHSKTALSDNVRDKKT